MWVATREAVSAVQEQGMLLNASFPGRVLCTFQGVTSHANSLIEVAPPLPVGDGEGAVVVRVVCDQQHLGSLLSGWRRLGTVGLS